jgi:dimethylargininase
MPTAIVRDVPSTFDQALVMGDRPPLDVTKARRQHADYCARLHHAGYDLVELPADDLYPDCLFVEDTAVVLGPMGVICRPGAPSRSGEIAVVSKALAPLFELRTVEEPGTIDGGDVMVMGETIYVGLSARTNQEAVSQLSEFAAEVGMSVVPIEVKEVLHLKSAVLPIDAETVVVTEGTVNEAELGDLKIIPEASEERHRFSALPLVDGTVLVTANSPRTSGLVADAGHLVIPIDVSEIQAADGGLTCMSILY